MSRHFSPEDELPTFGDEHWSSPSASHSLRLPMLNWAQVGLIAIFFVSFVAARWYLDPEDKETAIWSSRTRHARGSIWTAALSSNGRILADGGHDGTLVIREMEKGIEEEFGGDRRVRVDCLAFSVDGSTLAAGHGDSTVTLWDLATRAKRATLKGHAKRVKCLAFSADGKTLASAGDDPYIRVWDVASGRTEATLPGHRGSICALSFAPGGSTLASSCAGGMVKLWDLDRGGSRDLTGPGDRNQPVLGLSFSPDGTMLASGGVCDGLRLWHVATGRQVTTIRCENASVRGVKFSDDGRRLVEVRLNGLVVLWDLATRNKSTLQTNCSNSYCAPVSSDARYLAMGDHDGMLKVWDLRDAVSNGSGKRTPSRSEIRTRR